MNRVRWMLLAVGALLAVNLWHWWPRDKMKGTRVSPPATRVTGGRLEDYRLRAAVDGGLTGPQRDLFRPKLPPPPVVRKPRPPPPKSAQQLAEEAARAELAQIRLVGVAIRAGQGEAYLTVNGHAQHVRTGDKVGTRFVVESIFAEGILLRDPGTGVQGQLGVSGQ